MTAVSFEAFEAALTVGDTNDTSTLTSGAIDIPADYTGVALTDTNLAGRPADFQNAADTHDVVNAQGNVVAENLSCVSPGTHRYSRNGVEITQAQFETLLTAIVADATPDDSVEVIFGAIATEHRLTTDETF